MIKVIDLVIPVDGIDVSRDAMETISSVRPQQPTNISRSAIIGSPRGTNMNAVSPLASSDSCKTAGYGGYRGYTNKKSRKQAAFPGREAVSPRAVNAGYRGYGVVAFSAVNAAALRALPALLARWLPDGRVVGKEYEARNPRRNDRNLGSFRVNLRNGRWADFATGDTGGDPVSLAAYLFGLSQGQAVRRLADMLGLR